MTMSPDTLRKEYDPIEVIPLLMVRLLMVL